jgi:hypothetical protein
MLDTLHVRFAVQEHWRKEGTMRVTRRILVVIVAVMFVTGLAFAGDEPKQADNPNMDRIVENLVHGLNIDNCGVEHDCLWLLGELKRTEGIIRILELLHDGSCEPCRICAALALCRIGDPRGTYAVKCAVKDDPSPKVRNLCAYFYNEYVRQGTFAFVPVPEK